jgi:hypothetical protein
VGAVGRDRERKHDQRRRRGLGDRRAAFGSRAAERTPAPAGFGRYSEFHH